MMNRVIFGRPRVIQHSDVLSEGNWILSPRRHHLPQTGPGPAGRPRPCSKEVRYWHRRSAGGTTRAGSLRGG